MPELVVDAPDNGEALQLIRVVMPLGVGELPASVRHDVLLARCIALHKYGREANLAGIGVHFCLPVIVKMA